MNLSDDAVDDCCWLSDDDDDPPCEINELVLLSLDLVGGGDLLRSTSVVDADR